MSQIQLPKACNAKAWICMERREYNAHKLEIKRKPNKNPKNFILKATQQNRETYQPRSPKIFLPEF